MDIFKWLQLFAEQFKEIGWLQWLGLLAGIAEVLLARNNRIGLYPAGIVASGISVFLLYEAGLYGECLLSMYYIVMSVYGWWYWLNKKNVSPVKASYSSRYVLQMVVVFVLVGYTILYVALRYLTPSTVPHLDAFVSATAWAGMWLLARRKIENWILLNISNAVAIPLLFHKELPLYGFLTAFLFVIAIQGYFKWKKEIAKSHEMQELPDMKKCL
jgi:nicotinamide mononucleotide transporter